MCSFFNKLDISIKSFTDLLVSVFLRAKVNQTILRWTKRLALKQWYRNFIYIFFISPFSLVTQKVNIFW